MWGICGIVRFDGAIVSPAPVQAMMTSLAHRGRDDEGMWLDRGVGLGHRRLAIIDLSGGHQPMSNEDDHIHVVLNGMIYNYQEFRRELLQAGHSFRTKSDTEILVHAFPPIANSRHRRMLLRFELESSSQDTRISFYEHGQRSHALVARLLAGLSNKGGPLFCHLGFRD
jgi:glucosamine 6-phosphate synthetase-like amidotransferase/phosphosugar isomerase protein